MYARSARQALGSVFSRSDQSFPPSRAARVGGIPVRQAVGVMLNPCNFSSSESNARGSSFSTSPLALQTASLTRPTASMGNICGSCAQPVKGRSVAIVPKRGSGCRGGASSGRRMRCRFLLANKLPMAAHHQRGVVPTRLEIRQRHRQLLLPRPEILLAGSIERSAALIDGLAGCIGYQKL